MEKEYVFQLTIEEFKELLKKSYRELMNDLTGRDVEPVELKTSFDKYSYGLQGLADLIGCSRTTAWKIKNSGKIDKAIRQIGRKIIIDNEKALELLK